MHTPDSYAEPPIQVGAYLGVERGVAQRLTEAEASIAHVLAEINSVKRELAHLKRENERLERENERLERERKEGNTRVFKISTQEEYA